MRKKAMVLAIGTVLVAPSALADVELFGKAVQVCGKIHLSVDSYDRGTATASVTDPSDTEVASNSSRLGFKGEVDLDDALKAVWKFESEVDFTGESTEFGARDRYLGLKGGFGQFLAGNHDTPLKNVASAATLFGDTVADRRSIFGQTSSGDNQFN